MADKTLKDLPEFMEAIEKVKELATKHDIALVLCAAPEKGKGAFIGYSGSNIYILTLLEQAFKGVLSALPADSPDPEKAEDVGESLNSSDMQIINKRPNLN